MTVTGWMRCLAHALQDKISSEEEVLKDGEVGPDATDDVKIAALGLRLDGFAKLLQLNPCDKHGRVKQKLQLIFYARIEGVHLVCPDDFKCETVDCKPWALRQITKP